MWRNAQTFIQKLKVIKTSTKHLLVNNVCVSAAETSVQQANKQVQVDLQDLGYETCGRSENEAEREDASSPGDKLLLLLFNLMAILIQTLLIVISIGVR